MAYLSLFFHTIVLLLWPATPVIASFSGNRTDHLALLAIMSSITRDPQRFLDRWNNSFHFCEWEGVTCGRRHPRVISLDLSSRGIVGSLSPQIGNLTFLRVIRLSNNTFKGGIPPQVGDLFRLQQLFLYNNSFEGEIPASLSNCTRLKILGLGGNKLVGKIPQQLSSLMNLRILVIHLNGITGRIPSYIGNFTFLESISVFGNHLGGNIPNALGQLHNLEKIGFGMNQFYGMIPPSLYNLTSLRFLGFEDNQISGYLPKSIGLQLPNLEIIQLYGNKFTGSIPFSFSNLSNLLSLDLSENDFTGKVDVNFKLIPNLNTLCLYTNSLGTWEPNGMDFIDSLTNCSMLEILLVQDNQFRGVLPSSIGNLSPQLLLLGLGQNFIYGPLPSGIGNLVNLGELYIAYSQLTGIIPSELCSLGYLGRLYLHSNHLIGNIPNCIGNMSSLSLLYLYDNTIEGQIPQNLGNIRSLSSLDLSTNNLTGHIPIELFQLPSVLVDLFLDQNHLVGPLPQEIGKLKSLTRLDVSQNDLVGEIPDAIASCTSLEYVNLKNNSFEGPIPSAINTLRGITMLDLSCNNFSGKIPVFLEQLNLSTLNISFNNLYGEVPTGGIFKNASAIALDGNNGLCGGVPELQLPKCDLVARSKKGSIVIRVIIPLCVALVVVVALFLLFCWKRRKSQAQPPATSLVPPFSRVSYGSIAKATNEFSQQNLIGMGAFSIVYKGILEPIGAMVAIKVLKIGNQGAIKSFMAECEALKNIRHRNLVKIITSCSSIDFQGNDFKALVYEFMPNGNLERWIHPTEEAAQRLSLGQRVTIAIDVAHAIHYLHQDCEPPIIHCDLKPSNILLDCDMVAHIGDFGLAKFLPLKPHESSSLGIRGTIGYAAPEYGLGSEMTKEGDIYSFGILLLEMMTGKRPTEPEFQEGLNLHSYVKMAFPDRVMEIIEPDLRYTVDGVIKWKKLEEGMISLVKIGLACSVDSPRERMDTGKIIQELHRINSILVSN